MATTAPLDYACPSNYGKTRDQISIPNNHTCLEHFRDEIVWNNLTFDEYKDSMRDWKTNFFVPHLQSGNTIYEAGCDLGWNLYLTLEILSEYNVSDLTVYGNTLHNHNVQYVNWTLNTLLQAQNQNHSFLLPNHQGIFCRMDDATDLTSIVPANSFDLVYTGHMR